MGQKQGYSNFFIFSVILGAWEQTGITAVSLIFEF